MCLLNSKLSAILLNKAAGHNRRRLYWRVRDAQIGQGSPIARQV